MNSQNITTYLPSLLDCFHTNSIVMNIHRESLIYNCLHYDNAYMIAVVIAASRGQGSVENDQRTRLGRVNTHLGVRLACQSCSQAPAKVSIIIRCTVAKVKTGVGLVALSLDRTARSHEDEHRRRPRAQGVQEEITPY